MVFYQKRHQVHVDRGVVGCSAGRHVDHPCGGAISPWPKVTEFSDFAIFGELAFLNGVGADGVGVKFPILPVNCSRFLLS